SGISPSRLTFSIFLSSLRSPPASLLSTSAASPSTVGLRNNSFRLISTPSTPRIRPNTCVALNECPPNSKKLSCTPTRPTPNTSFQIPAITSSSPLRASTYSSLTPPSPPSGNPRLSTFPLIVRGNSSISTYLLGLITSDNSSATSSLTCFALSPGSITTYAHRYFSAPRCWSITATSLTPAHLLIASSISPNSTLTPRIFTWLSFLPRHS